MQEAKRIAKFGAVGIINTLIDFVVLDVLHLKFGMALIAANIVSTTVAMAFSFVANRTVVFKHHTDKVARQLVLFWAVTAFGLYVLQSGILWAFDHPLHSVLDASVRLVHDAGFHGLSARFIRTNTAKLVADLITLVWNYVLYKEVVFAHKPAEGQAKDGR